MDFDIPVEKVEAKRDSPDLSRAVGPELFSLERLVSERNVLLRVVKHDTFEKEGILRDRLQQEITTMQGVLVKCESVLKRWGAEESRMGLSQFSDEDYRIPSDDELDANAGTAEICDGIDQEVAGAAEDCGDIMCSSGLTTPGSSASRSTSPPPFALPPAAR